MDVVFQTKPEGARVKIDGTKMKRTNTILPVKPGTHQLVLVDEKRTQLDSIIDVIEIKEGVNEPIVRSMPTRSLSSEIDNFMYNLLLKDNR